MLKNGLNNNQLKLIALLSMTLDHIAVMVFPQVILLRILGRLAFPIYAYMIAEGCTHTHSMGKYFGTMAALAAVCQGAYYFALGSLYQSILVTFSLSIGLIWLIKWAYEKKTVGRWIAVAAGLFVALFLTELLTRLLKGTDYAVDYGFLGVILPVAVFLAGTKKQKLAVTLVILVLMAVTDLPRQWAALLALPLLALYNGRRGKRKMKWLFYIYYPAHMLILQGISLLIS